MGLAIAVRVLPLAVLLTGCALHGTASPPKRAKPVVIVDNQGTCPIKIGAPRSRDVTCRWSREYHANGMTDIFILPRVPWGIAYAYNCRGSGDFYAVVGMPTADAFMPDTRIYDPKPRDRGYHMETGKGIAIYDTTPKIWRNPEDVETLSSCHWHVRVVLGTARVVARHVPPLPTTG